jgi:hypothetical protein
MTYQQGLNALIKVDEDKVSSWKDSLVSGRFTTNRLFKVPKRLFYRPSKMELIDRSLPSTKFGL